MALTIDDLITELRLGDTTEERAIATRLLGVANQIVEREAPNAPDVLKEEAAIRIAGYLYDQPLAASGARHANAFRNSGALSLLAPYRVMRAGIAG